VLKTAGRGGRGLLGLFVAVVALCFCIEPAARGIRYLAARRSAEAPNLILISIDSLRADRAYCHGKMPALQRYASGGSLLTAANSQASWTLPSHASLFSSRYPAEHGAGRPQGSGLSPEVLTLAEILAQHSYETVAFTGGGWLSPYFGMDQGFAVFDTHGEMLLRPDYNPLSMLLFPNFERRADYWRIKVENWLKRRFAQRTPFFLFLHTYQVHDYFKNAPYLAAHLKRAGARYDPHFLLPQLSTNSDENARGGDHILVAPPNQIAYLETLYDAAASYLDSELEGILKRLSHEDLSRKTLVILTSDHGEGFKLEPRRLHHGGRLHQDLLHVPMLIRFDGVVPAGQKISTPVASLDLMPTALDLLGIPSPPDMRGVSLKDLIVVGGQPAQRLIFAEEVGYEITADYSRRELAANERQTALIADGIKFIRNLEGEELYDLKVDPDEVQNQLSSKPSLASRLRAATQEFQDRYPCCLTPAGPKEGLSPDLQRQLQSLGYL